MNGFATEVLRGTHEIVRGQEMLRGLAAGCGQQEAIADIHYYLDKPGLWSRTPVLLILRREGSQRDEPSGAILLFEYKFAGIPLGLYTSNDRSGRRTVVAATGERLDMAVRGVEHLLRHGANVVMLSFRSTGMTAAICEELTRESSGTSWLFHQREVPDYLELQPGYDATLATIGKRTRTHMRYYRRRAESELGCRFDPELEMNERELIAFNWQCMYPVPQQVLTWRLRALRQFERPVLMALRGADGQLLSVLAARRFGQDSDVLWQMNRAGLEGHSLCLVMRTYFIEEEIRCGTQRLYFDGGSSNSLLHSFARGVVTEFGAMRHTPLSFLVRRIARRVIPRDNPLCDLMEKEVKSPAREAYLRTE